MSRLIRLVVAVLLGSFVLAGCGSDAKVQTVSPQEWLSVAGQAGVTLVDVRTPEEYAAGHVQDAVNINVEGADFNDRIAQLDPSGTYALYCRSGNRSAVAADAMEKAGFENVYNLKGGMTDLQAAGATIVAG